MHKFIYFSIVMNNKTLLNEGIFLMTKKIKISNKSKQIKVNKSAHIVIKNIYSIVTKINK